MWMSGAPGVGKSAIAQTVCEELCGDDGSMSWLSRIVYRVRYAVCLTTYAFSDYDDRYIDGCFFFGRGFESREKASLFPATIAFQLCRSRVSCRAAIDKTIERRPEILSEKFPSQFRQLLIKAAQTTGFLEGPITVVVDGLDECNSIPDQVTLLELILEAVKTGNMRFFIASRPEQHIHTFFHRPDVTQHTYHVRLDEETFKTSNDIKTFLREEFARIRQANPESCHRLPNGEEWPGERVLNRLTVESDSQFMFPTLAIGFIDTPFFSPERQLQILLEAPPSGAFSALDTLYHKILSRQPPTHFLRGEGDLHDYQEVVIQILRVIIAWSGRPLSAAKIAIVLDKPYDVVQRIVRGPMRTLFKFHTSEPDSPITLCHKSLRDYLLDRVRSREFFIPSVEEDDLFVTILSRCPTAHLAHPNIQGIAMDVLSFLYACDSDDDVAYLARSVSNIAAFLDVDFTLVDYVVNIGPTSLLFNVGGDRSEEDEDGESDDEEDEWEDEEDLSEEDEDEEEEENENYESEGDEVDFCTKSFMDFLRDPGRSGRFFLSNRRIDTLFLHTLSHRPASASPYPCSRNTVVDILAVLNVPLYSRPAIAQVAALLEIDSRIVEQVVTSSPAKWLVSVGKHGTVALINEWVLEFLHDSDRSGEFCISSRRLDPYFIRLLSQRLGSDSSQAASHDVLMSVLTVIMAFHQELTVHQIAFILDVDHTLVEGVVKFGPTNPLFIFDLDEVNLSTPSFDRFLLDSDRSGIFFISNGRMDTLFSQTLSRRRPSDPYSGPVLLDILAVTLDFYLNSSISRPSMRQIATFLGIDRTFVKQVVKFGAEKWMFKVDEDDRVEVPGFDLREFLLDADRSGQLFISDRRLDPFFVRLLSQQPAPHPSHSGAGYHDTMLRVLAAAVAFEGNLTINQIASVVGAHPLFVEGVVAVGPTKVLFAMEKSEVKILFGSLQSFLQDASRSGKFFVAQSSIDALFTHILSNGPTSQPSQNLLIDIITVILMAEDTSDPSLRRVAAFLEVDLGHIERIVSGPAKELFQVTWGSIQFSTQLLRPFFREADRAGVFCITETMMDNLFIRFLSRHLPAEPTPSPTRNTLTSVLSVMAHSHEGSEWTESRLAAFLDIDHTLIEGVINKGPSWVLFTVVEDEQERISSFFPLLQHFLKDASRSGQFSISDKSLDPYFSRIFSSSPPLGDSQSPSPQDVLKDVLAVGLISREESLTVLGAATALDVDVSFVDNVFKGGLSRLLFGIDWEGTFTFSATSLYNYLQDAERSGELCIPNAKIDALFFRILSRPPPPHFSPPHLKDVLLGVIAVILTSPVPLTIVKIAAHLRLDHCVVKGVMEFLPAKVLFSLEENPNAVKFAGPLLKPFLQDANRSGEFFIPPTMTLDNIPKPWVQPPPNIPEVSYLDGIGEDKESEDVKDKAGEHPEVHQESAGLKLDTSLQNPLSALPRPKRKFSR